jgi:hypothetical protein
MFKPSLIVQETDPSRSLGLLRACGERPSDGRAAQECDEFALSHAKLPVDDEAYQRQRCASHQIFAGSADMGQWTKPLAR